MKCLLVADLHYDLRKFDWVLDAAAHVDLVILAGDHLEIASIVARPAQAVVVQQYFRRIRERALLMVSSGNHDLDVEEDGALVARWVRKAPLYGVPADGEGVFIGDTLFTICPWWHSELQEARVLSQLEADAARRPGRWVWVHHAPPGHSPTSWGGHRDFGSQVLRGWIEALQPDIVLTGHVHQAPFVRDGSWADRIGRSWVFNAGHQTGPVPSHIVIDTATTRAYWLSLTNEETAPLEPVPVRPLPRLTEPPEWLNAMAQLAALRM
ncbi:MAG: metallophosphoesterase [Bauldia sp.]